MENLFEHITDKLNGYLKGIDSGLTPEEKIKFNVHKQNVVKVMQNEDLTLAEKEIELNKIQEDANKNT